MKLTENVNIWEANTIHGTKESGGQKNWVIHWTGDN